MIAVLRLPLLPFAFVAELALLVLGWILAFAWPVKAERLVQWGLLRLPGLDWYLGRTPVSFAHGPTPQSLNQESKMDALSDYQPYAGIIQSALAARGNSPGDNDRHPSFSAPTYVVRMCEALTLALKEAGREQTTLAELVRLESTCTGADYQHKLAMRCQRLASGQ